MGGLTEAYSSRADKLFFYSPYNFIKEIDRSLQKKLFIEDRIEQFSDPESNHKTFSVEVNSFVYFFLYSYLSWDTDFFKVKTYKLFTVLYTASDAKSLTEAVQAFKTYLFQEEKVYCFIEIPAEDILLQQCLGNAGFRTIETRLNYYKDNLHKFKQERYPVRKATLADAELVGQISAEMRNEYDRFHADHFFTQEQGDNFLEAYASAAVNGYCDTVLIPDQEGLPAEAFLAISHLQHDSNKLNCQLARVVLTAVTPSCKGWHLKLVSETTHYAKSMGAKYVLMTTQATNRAVFRTNEKLGYKLGGTVQVLAINN